MPDPQLAPEAAVLEGLVDAEPSTCARLCFVDVETTGLDVERHEVWELAVINGESELHRFLPITPALADPNALRMNHYYEHHPAHGGRDFGGGSWVGLDPQEIAQEVARLTAGAHLAGVNPAFDAAFLGALLRRYDAVPAWQYHLIDVLPLIAGRCQVRPPWRSNELSERLGIPPPDEAQRHTALGDARWAQTIYEAVMTR